MRFIKKEPTHNKHALLETYANFDIHPTLAEVLATRGIAAADASEFLNPSREQLLNPYAFGNMEQVVERLNCAVSTGEQVTIYGDYDCDGTSSCAILLGCLRACGLEADYYIPDRKTEGYGTNEDAFRRIIEGGTTLIITVDCGIRSNEDVAFARARGADVIILDHHECDVLPETPYILNPKVPGEPYPFKHLCGAGIVFKLAQALLGDSAMAFIDLAGMATIGDIVPLVGENRVLAALGIEKLKNEPIPGLRELCRVAGIVPQQIDSGRVSFGLVPRINVAGRLEHASLALELLLSKTAKEAKPLAQELNALNNRRQSMQRKAIEEAINMVRENINLSRARLIYVSSPNWDKGIVGLVASHLVEQFHRPTVVFSESDGMLVGSARSIPGINLYEALVTCQEEYEQFGGHEMAAGLTVRKEVFGDAAERINAYLIEKYPEDIFLNTVYYDMELKKGDITMGLIQQLAKLEPVGQENPEPTFFIASFLPRRVQALGDGSHLKFHWDGPEAIWFGAKQEVLPRREYAVLTSLSINEFRGRRTPQLIVRALAEQKVEQEELKRRAYARLLRDLPRELTAYAAYRERSGMKAAPVDEVEELIKTPSLFGMAVFIGSVGGIELLEGFSGLASLKRVEKLPMDSGESLVCYAPPVGDLSNFEHIILLGCFRAIDEYPEAHVYMGTDVEAQYRELANACFVSEEHLGEYQAAFEIEGDKGFDAVREVLIRVMARMGESTMERSWFALQVLLERELLQTTKDDKIYIIPNLEKKDGIGEDTLYRAVSQILEEV